MHFLFKLVLGVALALSAAASAQYTKGSIFIGHPWSRATPPGATVAGGYVVIENKGPTTDRLVSATVEVAGRVEIHEMSMDRGVMKMRPLPRGLEIKAGATATFKPGGYHMMFTGLKRPLKEGERFKGTLVFEKAGAIEVEFTVEGMGTQPTKQSH